ncbi:MAG: glycine betaine ABC transporter substrate-binding protein [Clostridiaceae bacterium]|nr:glycine betaine ABC transporter substrate-binding protein [Clostridiaceae bacterium]
MSKKGLLSLLLIGVLVFAVACAPADEPADVEPGDVDAGTEVEEAVEEKGSVEIGYVAWDCAIASTHVMKTVLEDAGYDVTLTDASGALLYQELASGDLDFMTTAWLPYTHESYMDQFDGQLLDLGSNYSGEARIGLVVPEYMDIDSIEDLDGTIADGQIVGIDPGAGIMSAAEAAIVDYDLDYNLLEGTDAVMAAALRDAIDNEEEVIVTGWAPHWKFGRWELKFLEDPKESFGSIEDIHTLARLGLDEDMPELYNIIDNFNWSDADISAVMDMNSEGMDPNESARIWVDANQDKVQEWLQ